MIPERITYCPCTLAEGFNTYSPAALRLLFDRRMVSHLLDFDPPALDEVVSENFRQNSKAISISGTQFKQSLIVENQKLRLTLPGEPGRYILKPIPSKPPFRMADELPANEHLTMQIARQAYGIDTAVCALVFFKNGEPAYLTRRFDYSTDGTRIAQEDFASIIGKSKDQDGDHFRNMGSYEAIARAMNRYVAAYPVEIEKFFERIVFNYMFSNGDAHLKNFSLQQSPGGDYLLSPAYDLINTAIHIPNDSYFALEDGLFSGDYQSESFQTLGFYTYDDFYEFGLRIGMLEIRIRKLLDKYRSVNHQTLSLIDRSFLTPYVKERYAGQYHQRVSMLNNSRSQKT